MPVVIVRQRDGANNPMRQRPGITVNTRAERITENAALHTVLQRDVLAGAVTLRLTQPDELFVNAIRERVTGSHSFRYLCGDGAGLLYARLTN